MTGGPATSETPQAIVTTGSPPIREGRGLCRKRTYCVTSIDIHVTKATDILVVNKSSGRSAKERRFRAAMVTTNWAKCNNKQIINAAIFRGNEITKNEFTATYKGSIETTKLIIILHNR
jgi:hypothetical protein